jgi:hypothetical protein
LPPLDDDRHVREEGSELVGVLSGREQSSARVHRPGARKRIDHEGVPEAGGASQAERWAQSRLHVAGTRRFGGHQQSRRRHRDAPADRRAGSLMLI